jgi:hypothetical protein
MTTDRVLAGQHRWHRGITVAAALILTLGRAAAALGAVTTTGALLLEGTASDGTSGFVSCTATNPGKKPVDVDVEVVDASGGDIVEATNTSCRQLEPLRACVIEVANPSGAVTYVACRITSSAAVRGILVNVRSGAASEAR